MTFFVPLTQEIKAHQNLVSAIKSRYDFMSKAVNNHNGSTVIRVNDLSLSLDSDSKLSQSQLSSSLPESHILIHLPKRTRTKKLSDTKNICINNDLVDCVGDELELQSMCENLEELDLARNELNDWVQVKKILVNLKRLKHLNLCNNPLKNAHIEKNSNQVEDKRGDLDELTRGLETILPLKDSDDIEPIHFDTYFIKNWSIEEDGNKSDSLKTLILNNCYIDNEILELLLIRLPVLEELHLARNNYARIKFSETFRKESIKILYLNSNNLSEWSEILRLGICFQNLETLVLSENQLGDIPESIEFEKAFPKLKILNLNELNIKKWETIDILRGLCSLKNIRLKGIPLVKDLDQEKRFYMLLSYLKEDLDYLNGSPVSQEEINKCQRKFLNHFTNDKEKPKRYFELREKFKIDY